LRISAFEELVMMLLIPTILRAVPNYYNPEVDNFDQKKL
jgi:hypothetical protein